MSPPKKTHDSKEEQTINGPVDAANMSGTIDLSEIGAPRGRIARIRRLNDALRSQRRGGTVLVTDGISALGPDATLTILTAVARFDRFNESIDPYSEHDFGAVDVDDHSVFFKIDYYDRSHRLHSPDPADPKVTARVLTIMLRDEY
jgi:hypothetical protein